MCQPQSPAPGQFPGKIGTGRVPSRWCLLAVAVVLLAAAPAQAMVMVPPPSIAGSPGTPYRLAFVTSGPFTTTGASPAIGTYDAVVAAAVASSAPLAALTTTWAAIASVPGLDARIHTGTNPAFNGGSLGVPIFLVNGTPLAGSNDALWGTTGAPLLSPLNVDQTGTIIPGTLVWTGTTPAGAASASPLGGGGGVSTFGSNTTTGTSWVTSIIPAAQGSTGSVYGISGILTVPVVTAIPEPGSFMALAIGTVVIFGGRRWRQRRSQTAKSS